MLWYIEVLISCRDMQIQIIMFVSEKQYINIFLWPIFVSCESYDCKYIWFKWKTEIRVFYSETNLKQELLIRFLKKMYPCALHLNSENFNDLFSTVRWNKKIHKTTLVDNWVVFKSEHFPFVDHKYYFMNITIESILFIYFLLSTLSKDSHNENKVHITIIKEPLN